MASGVQVHKAYVVNTYPSKEIVGWYDTQALAQRVVSFLTECSCGRVPNDFGIEERTVETVTIEAGRVLTHGKNLTRVLATFDPESCIAFVERLERKVPNEPIQIKFSAKYRSSQG